jgi:predicted MFS family arabinose efflux permease
MATYSRTVSLDAFTSKDAHMLSSPPLPGGDCQAPSIVEYSVSSPVMPPYSTFTQRQKRLILCLISFAATFSPLSSFIFFPAIDALSRSLRVSVGRINLTITSYMIVAGIAPAIMGDMADIMGRRIIYLFMMSIYCVANVGLALQSNWAALFILRMLQSTGSAGV